MTGKKLKPRAARIDWEAVERDFRTGKFTQVELCRKHGMAEATLCRRIKADQDADKSRWQKDLTTAIRQATNAAVTAALVKTQSIDGQEKVNFAVKAAAEVNTQVILRHRSDILAARTVAYDLLAELQNAAMLAEHQDLLTEILAGDGASIKDANEARATVARALGLGSRVGSIKALSEALTKLQAAERTAFKLDDDDHGDANSAGMRQLSDTELASRLARLMADVGVSE